MWLGMRQGLVPHVELNHVTKSFSNKYITQLKDLITYFLHL